MRFRFYLSGFLLFLFAAACAVNTTIEVHNDASGSAEVEISLHPVAVEYMSDVAASFGGEGETAPNPFDIEAIKRSFLARDGMKLESIETKGTGTLRLTVGFDDVTKLLGIPDTCPDTGDSGKELNPLSFSMEGGTHTLSLKLTRRNFYRISGLFILPDSPLTVLLPYSESDFMPRDEYIEVLSYALEDYLGTVSVQEFVSGAGVDARISADSPILQTAGGKLSDGGAEFFIPLVDALTLEDDIERAVSW